jgi:hypothetical protein
MPKKPAAVPHTTTLQFAGGELVVTHETASLDSLQLDPDNPRIRLHLDGGKKGPSTPEALMKLIEDQPGYDDLHKQIRDQGGVHDELIVRYDGRIVEGNTRYTIAKKLLETPGGKAKWGTLPIKRLAKNVDEVTIGLLMCNYHVSGKTAWRPAAQAAEVYRLVLAKAPVAQILAATRMTQKRLDNYVAAYKMLLEEIAPLAPDARRRDVIDSKFHHALEFVTRADLEEVRKDPVARKQVVSAIASNNIQGAQMRKLAPIMKNARARETFVREGYKAAETVDKKANPLTRSNAVKAVQNLTKKLGGLRGPDLDVFIKHAKARGALEDLAGAIDGLLRVATPKSEKKRA